MLMCVHANYINKLIAVKFLTLIVLFQNVGSLLLAAGYRVIMDYLYVVSFDGSIHV
jgi:hypothetical protein